MKRKEQARQRGHKALVACGEAAPLCEQTGPELSVRKWHGVWSPLSHVGEGVQLQYPLAKSEVLKSNSLVTDSGAHRSPSFEDQEMCHPGQQPLKVTPWDKPPLYQDAPLFPEEVAGNRLHTCLAAFLQPECPMPASGTMSHVCKSLL